MWTQLYACLQDFLFHAAPRQLPASRTADEAAEDEALDVGLADMLALHMLRCAAGVPFLHARLISILQLTITPPRACVAFLAYFDSRIAHAHRTRHTTHSGKDRCSMRSRPTSGRPSPRAATPISAACAPTPRTPMVPLPHRNPAPRAIASLTLCRNIRTDGYSCHGRVGRLAFPLVMARARAVLHRFVEDDERRLAAGRPLPRHQLAEVTALLRQLRDLQLQPGLPLPETEAEETMVGLLVSCCSVCVSCRVLMLTHDMQESGGRVWRSREHLLRLYPQLCDCITTREDQVKPLLRELFHIAGAQVGLQ